MDVGLFAEQTLVIIKPDGVRFNFTEKILTLLRDLDLYTRERMTRKMTIEECQKLYSKTRQKLPEIYTQVEKSMISGDSVFLIMAGVGAIRKVRELRGPTDLSKAIPGQVRYDFISDLARERSARGEYPGNVMHASDNAEEAEFEINLFFSKERLL